MTTADQPVTQWIKQRRRELGLTQDVLAERTACSPETVRKIERGALRPSRQLADLLAEALEIAPAERAAFVTALRTGGPPHPITPRVSQNGAKHNLPFQTASFVGRLAELEQLEELFARADVRLVTLTGPGGSGKTRLALDAAGGMLAEFPNGVWFVDLSPLTDPGLVATSIAEVLGVRAVAGEPQSKTLGEWLAGRRILLLLDNFEQVVAAAETVTALLQAAGGLKVLATSRVPLHLYGEKEFPVPPLGLPERAHLPSIEQLTQYEAVRLFIERARDVRPDFAVNNENAPAVAEICARLDGLPLAIELAAARVKVLSPQALLTRLDHRFSLLTGGAVNLPPRQRTLRATIEWSYNLLTADGQKLLRRMSVFLGGATIDTIAAVCSLNNDLRGDVFEATAALVDRSLLKQADGVDGEPRFTMLETIREYGHEQLAALGEDTAVKVAHARYFVELGEKAGAALLSDQRLRVTRQLNAEEDNMRAALGWLLQQQEPEYALQALRLAGALGWYWESRSRLDEGWHWLEQAIARSAELPGNEQSTTARFGAVNAMFNVSRGLYASAERDRGLADEGLRLARELGKPAFMAQALHHLIDVRWQYDHAASELLLREGESWARQSGNKWLVGHALLQRAEFFRREDQLEQATACAQESFRVLVESGDRWGAAAPARMLGILALAAGDLDRAQAYFEQALARWREVNNPGGIRLFLGRLAQVARLRGAYELAELRLNESRTIAHEQQTRLSEAWAISALAHLRHEMGDYAGAEELLDECLAIFRQSADWMGIGATELYQGYVAVRRGEWQRAAGLFHAAMSRLRDTGDSRGFEGDVIDGVASVLVVEKRYAQAARLLGAVDALVGKSKSNWVRIDQQLWEQSVAQARAALGEAGFAAAWAEGGALTADQAINEAVEAAARVAASTASSESQAI